MPVLASSSRSATASYRLSGQPHGLFALLSRSRSARASVAADALADTSTNSISGSGRYAIVNLGGLQQLLSEGQMYACSKQAVKQAAPGAKLQLNTVMALKDGTDICWGEPYLQDVVVEAELMEDFAGPVLRRITPDGKSTEHPETLSKFLVTRIVSGAGIA